jgi:Leucine-rich repeat (LRR) protein
MRRVGWVAIALAAAGCLPWEKPQPQWEFRRLEEAAAKGAEARSLALYNAGLTNLPPQLCDLTGLIKLSLRGNRMRVIPAELARLENLEWLDLGDMELVDLPARLGSLTRLHTLYLNDNLLTDLPASFGDLAALRY